jgi:hypothetical protein
MLNPLLARIGFFRGAEKLVASFAPSWLYLDERVKYDAATKAAAERAAS